MNFNNSIYFTLIISLFNLGCTGSKSEKLIDRCKEQLKEETPFIDADGYCDCVIPKVYDFTENENIDLINILENKEFFDLVNKSPELIRITQECGKQNPTKNLTDTLKISDKLRQSLLRKYSTPLKKTAFETEHNIEKYCNCLIDQFDSKITIEKFINPDWYNSSEFKIINENCKLKSKNNN